MSDTPDSLYAGLSGVQLRADMYDLGDGILLKKTFAHLFSPFLVAFAPPGPEGHHPAPWSAAEGGVGFDIHVELCVPLDYSLSGTSNASDVVWWIAALLRAARYPYLSVPVLSDHPFSSVPTLGSREARLRPHEVRPRIMRPGVQADTHLDENLLEWLRDRWITAGRLIFSHGKLRSAFQAFDSATVEGKTSSALLSIWGGLEQIFGYGRLRLASFISAYLAPPGDERLALYKKVGKLYDARSAVAHTAGTVENEPLLESYVLMRNALIRMVDEGGVPTQSDLEALLFGAQDAPPA